MGKGWRGQKETYPVNHLRVAQHVVQRQGVGEVEREVHGVHEARGLVEDTPRSSDVRRCGGPHRGGWRRWAEVGPVVVEQASERTITHFGLRPRRRQGECGRRGGLLMVMWLLQGDLPQYGTYYSGRVCGLRGCLFLRRPDLIRSPQGFHLPRTVVGIAEAISLVRSERSR